MVAVNAQGLFALAWIDHGMPGYKIVTQTLRVSPMKVAAEADGNRTGLLSER